MKLSPTQLRVLRYASEGRLTGSRTGGAYVEGVYVFKGGRQGVVSCTTMDRLLDAGLVKYARPRSFRLEVTPKGQALLDEADE